MDCALQDRPAEIAKLYRKALDQASDLDQGGCRQEGASKAEGEAQADAGWGVSDGTIPEARFCRS